MIEKMYLGDGIYTEIERGMIKLTTDAGCGPTNTIYLEPDVYERLTQWVQRIEDECSRKRSETDESWVSSGPQGQEGAAPGETQEACCVQAEAFAAEGDEGDEEGWRVKTV